MAGGMQVVTMRDVGMMSGVFIATAGVVLKIFASPLTPDAMMRHVWANLRSSYFRTTP